MKIPEIVFQILSPLALPVVLAIGIGDRLGVPFCRAWVADLNTPRVPAAWL